jgi:hypothetical protein
MLALKYHRADAISTHRTARFASSHPAEAQNQDKGENDETKCRKEYRREETHNVATRDVTDSAPKTPACPYLAGNNSGQKYFGPLSSMDLARNGSVVMNKPRNTREL